MTLCIGVQYPDLVELYTDGLITSEGGPPDRSRKVFSAHGVVWAASGDIAVAQYLKTLDCRPIKGRQGFEKWFHGAVVPLWHERVLGLSSGQESIGDRCDLLAVHRGQLWEMSEGYAMTRVLNYTCIGSGAQYAHGYLACVREGTDVLLSGKEANLRCLRAVSKLDKCVGPPYFRYTINKAGALQEFIWNE